MAAVAAADTMEVAVGVLMVSDVMQFACVHVCMHVCVHCMYLYLHTCGFVVYISVSVYFIIFIIWIHVCVSLFACMHTCMPNRC